ncbi:MAG TPA: TIGR03000 domain-containing protein [Vicinamibacterales bacterium]|nr:TIGR03000 domain-containing protein [Vicinamibacterales bacterium]
MAITRGLLLLVSVFIFSTTNAAAHAPVLAVPQAQAPTASTVTSPMTVTVPQEDAELIVEGKTVIGAGSTRTFASPPLHPGDTYSYTFTARWLPNTYTTMTRSRTVSFRAGEPVSLDLTVEDPSDRVRVIYVPTPDDVAAEMVELAGVTAADIAYEPGCGDARITIAAVKGGARRGVGIDIDPDRVAESEANVKAAGLADKIEIRLGDALDIHDLSAATVVFLYMGDHFNMLIRPILWKELPVGARVVSHRFKMGDWEPDKTVTVTSTEGGDYDLHLWKITEDVKRRMAQGDDAGKFR